MPYISVIVPVYNAENSIERCVRSILDQQFSDMEILLIDDGAKDASGIICDKLAEEDSRIRVFHKENAGVSAARNTGFAFAEGKYILCVDSDDYLPVGYIKALVQAQEKFGEAVFFWTAMQVLSENGEVKEEKICYSQTVYAELSRKDVLKLSAKYLLNSPCNKLYCREIIQKNQLRMDEKISIAEDLLFNLQYLEAAGDCDIVVINHAVYCYVRNGQPSLDSGYRKNYYKIHKKVLGRLWNYTKKWQVPKEDIPLYYSRYWEYMQAALINNTYENSELSAWGKMRENGKIYRDKHFRKCLKSKKGTMGRGSYLMMRIGSGLLAWMYEKLRTDVKR